MKYIVFFPLSPQRNHIYTYMYYIHSGLGVVRFRFEPWAETGPHWSSTWGGRRGRAAREGGRGIKKHMRAVKEQERVLREDKREHKEPVLTPDYNCPVVCYLIYVSAKTAAYPRKPIQWCFAAQVMLQLQWKNSLLFSFGAQCRVAQIHATAIRTDDILSPSNFRPTHLLFFSLWEFSQQPGATIMVGSDAPCYFVNGEIASGARPCFRSLENTPCCWEDFSCLANGLCQSSTSNHTIWGTCTDNSWQSPYCPQYCRISSYTDSMRRAFFQWFFFFFGFNSKDSLIIVRV